MKVKICGITDLEDARSAASWGADFLGFIFIAKTPRCVSPERAAEIISGLHLCVKEKVGKVGLFADTDEVAVAEIAVKCGLDLIQLHGNESPEYCARLKEIIKGRYSAHIKIIKVFKVSDEIMPIGIHVPGDYAEADLFVFDAFHPKIAGGTGKTYDWGILSREKRSIGKPFFIAGGLNPVNVAEAVRIVRPYGVDVSSGVEKVTGRKDDKLVKEFVSNAKSA